MEPVPSYLKGEGDRYVLSVRLVPRSSRNEICGELGSALKIKVTAPPVDSAANQALIEFLSDRLHISKSAIQILKGHTSKSKLIQIDGLTVQDILAGLE